MELQSRIRPHFLFNTLANVKRLYETHPERGRHMLVALIAYLRAALPGMRRHESTLAEELELVRHYLAILQMRMGERLTFSIEAAPELLSARLPTLVLPTLVLQHTPLAAQVLFTPHQDEFVVELPNPRYTGRHRFAAERATAEDTYVRRSA